MPRLSRASSTLLAATTIFFLTLAAPLWGSTFVLMSDQQLAGASHGAWLATVESISTGMTAEGRIYTFVTLVADQKLRGASDMPNRITLRELGGRVGDNEMVVYGTPSYAVGEQVVAFLEQTPDGSFRTYQLAMGKFRVTTDPNSGATIALRDWGANPGRVIVANSQTGQSRTATPDGRPLSDLIDTIAAVSAPVTLPAAIRARPAEMDTSVSGPEGDAFTYLGLPARTQVFDAAGTITYLIDDTPPAGAPGATYTTTLQRGMDGWNHSTNNISLNSGAVTPLSSGFVCGQDKVENEDPQNDITDPSGCSGVLAIGGFCPSGTHAGPQPPPGGGSWRTITNSIVVFNNGWGGCGVWTPDNYAEIANHEFGHSIGFGHSSSGSEPDTSLAEAVMFASCCQGRGGSASTITAQDDEMMAAYSYPTFVNIPYYALDGFGAIHAGGGAAVITNPNQPPYFGFDIARAFDMTGTSQGLVGDGFGGIHAFGGEPAPSPTTPYFGFDILRGLTVIPGGGSLFYVLDGFGGIHPGNGASAVAGFPYFGFDAGAAVIAIANGQVYALDVFGGVHAVGGAPVISPASPYFGFDIARAMVMNQNMDRYYVADGLGGIHRGGFPAVISPTTPFFGFDVVAAMLLSHDDVAFLMLDKFGGVHRGGGAGTPSPSTPYFGFDVLRAIRLSQ